MNENRKLSTILFADITGYTAMMQADEQRALEWLQIFKERIEDEVPSHAGKIIQYYGDACLLSFESTSQGVRCAMSLQRLFRHEEIPVRMGIHLGEVVFTENNVFGDGVNIASRIESMGIPGAILLSRTVRDQIQNKSEFVLSSLGNFEFKNVAEAIEVFAVSNSGFNIPVREEMKGKLKKPGISGKNWIWPLSMTGLILVALLIWVVNSGSNLTLSEEDKKKPVAVIPFENQTMDASLDAIGLMAMDWISKGLLEGAGATVIKGEENEAGLMNWKELARSAEILVRGRFYKSGLEDLIFTADVVEAASEKILFSPDPITGHREDPMEVLVAMQQKLIGYWKLNGTFPGKPPRYDAYKLYIDAVQMDEPHPYEQEIALLERAADLDTAFAQPLFLLYHRSRWGGLESVQRNTVEKLQGRQHLFSPFHQLEWKAIEALDQGDMAGAAAINWKIYETYKQDYSAGNALSMYRFSNQLQKVIDLYEDFSPVTPDTVAGYAFGRYVNALYGLGRYEDVLNKFDSLTFTPTQMDGTMARLQALIRMNRIDELDHMMAFYKSHPMTYGGFENYSSVHSNVCATLYIMDRQDLLPKYLAEAKEWFEREESKFAFHGYAKAMLYFFSGDYEKAYSAGLEQLASLELAIFAEMAGVALVKMGRMDEVDQYIELLKSRYSLGFTAYSIGVIEAHRNPEEAIKWLAIADKEGCDYDFYSHRNDPMLKVIYDHPDFLSLTAPKQ